MNSLFFAWLTENQSVASIITQFISAISVIIASIAAVLISGRRERLKVKSIQRYYTSLIRVIWVDIKVFYLELEEYKDKEDLIDNLILAYEMGALHRCVTNVEKIRCNLIEYVQYSESNSIDDLHAFLLSFDLLIKLIEINKTTNSKDILLNIVTMTKKAADQMFVVMKEAYHLNTWYARKFLDVDKRLNNIKYK